MKRDTKQLLSTLAFETILFEAIVWCGVNHWKVSQFLVVNAVATALIGFFALFIMFVKWAVERS